MLAAADRLANLIDLKEHFNEVSKHDFSNFKRGEEKQDWYFRNAYLSIIENDNPDFPLFICLKEIIDNTFERTMEEYYENEKQLVKRIK